MAFRPKLCTFWGSFVFIFLKFCLCPVFILHLPIWPQKSEDTKGCSLSLNPFSCRLEKGTDVFTLFFWDFSNCLNQTQVLVSVEVCSPSLLACLQSCFDFSAQSWVELAHTAPKYRALSGKWPFGAGLFGMGVGRAFFLHPSKDSLFQSNKIAFLHFSKILGICCSTTTATTTFLGYPI